VVPPYGVQIGPLTRFISDRAKWRREDQFPAWQVWADETERVLAFLCAQDQLARFVPRLRDDARARNAALAEARVAFFLFRNGFRIVEWEPPASNGKIGEFSIRWNNGPIVLVEIKAPDWQGELSTGELLGDRKKLGKCAHLEARATDPLLQPTRVIEKNAVPKLPADRPSLVVIADDLFISPVGTPHLEHRIDGLLGKPENNVLGGLLFFKTEPYRNEIEYTIRFNANLYAMAPCQIPADVATGLTASSQSDEARRLRRYSGRSPVARFFRPEPPAARRAGV
jgi:hypothetical protein